MDLLATGNTVKPGLPARPGDAASDGEKTDETAIFEAFLGLALSVPSPDARIAAGPEGKTPESEPGDEATEPTGKAATASGNILPVQLPVLPEAYEELPAPDTKTGIAVAHSPIDALVEPKSVDAKGEVASGAARQVPVATVPQVQATEATAGETIAPPGQQSPSQAQINRVVADLQPRSTTAAVTLPVQNEQAAQRPTADEPIAMARAAVPVVRMLAGRQGTPNGSGEPAPLPDGAADAAFQSADQPQVTKPAGSTANGRSEAARITSQPATASTAPETTVKAGTQEALATSLPETASQTMAATRPSDQGTPVPVAQSVASNPTSTSATTGPAGTDAHDFTQIVERLARARDAEQGEVVRSTVATREFGAVAMQLRPVEGRLHVSLTSADPGFAPAVQAASGPGATGQQAASDSSSQTQSQQQGQAGHAFGQGQTAPDSQARRQQWEQAAQGQPIPNPATTTGDDLARSASDPRSANGSTIYA